MPTSLSTSVFISYRRADTAKAAAWLEEQLAKKFGRQQVFLDTVTLGSSAPWQDEIPRETLLSSVVLVLIGPEWLSIKDHTNKRRLDNPQDVLRQEIASALENGMRVIPVLVGGAQMPDKEHLPNGLEPLAELNAWTLSGQKRDFTRLVKRIRGYWNIEQSTVRVLTKPDLLEGKGWASMILGSPPLWLCITYGLVTTLAVFGPILQLAVGRSIPHGGWIFLAVSGVVSGAFYYLTTRHLGN